VTSTKMVSFELKFSIEIVNVVSGGPLSGVTIRAGSPGPGAGGASTVSEGDGAEVGSSVGGGFEVASTVSLGAAVALVLLSVGDTVVGAGGASVAGGGTKGKYRGWPMKMTLPDRQLACCISPTLVPVLCANANKVSPARTVYSAQFSLPFGAEHGDVGAGASTVSIAAGEVDAGEAGAGVSKGPPAGVSDAVRVFSVGLALAGRKGVAEAGGGGEVEESDPAGGIVKVGKERRSVDSGPANPQPSSASGISINGKHRILFFISVYSHTRTTRQQYRSVFI
jgi:hypothetical protein